jgi:hypothetical protein
MESQKIPNSKVIVKKKKNKARDPIF